MMTASSRDRSLRILIVEDHEDTLSCLRRRLEKAGHTVLEATSVGSALALLPSAEFDVLLSDLGLPDGTGWDLLTEANQVMGIPLYAVAMSGYGDSVDRERSKRAGFHHHLVKPFQKAELEAALDAATLRVPRGGERPCL